MQPRSKGKEIRCRIAGLSCKSVGAKFEHFAWNWINKTSKRKYSTAERMTFKSLCSYNLSVKLYTAIR